MQKRPFVQHFYLKLAISPLTSPPLYKLTPSKNPKNKPTGLDRAFTVSCLHTLSFVAAHQAPSKPNAFTAFLRPDAAGVVADFSDDAVICLSPIPKFSIPRGS